MGPSASLAGGCFRPDAHPPTVASPTSAIAHIARGPIALRTNDAPPLELRMGPPPSPAPAGGTSYDEAYYTKWYREPSTRVHAPESVRRKVRMVTSVAEYFLGRKLRTVLDIGAGEGRWRAELRRMRPDIRYIGVDPSEYVVARYGKERNIRLGAFEQLPSMSLGRGFDLIVCADVLQYVGDSALKRGVRHIAGLLGGVAFLEAYTTGDDMEGDLEGWHHRSKSRYRSIVADAGLVACGIHCYLTRELAANAVELELV
jgi:SAM-dependent methyltransferase